MTLSNQARGMQQTTWTLDLLSRLGYGSARQVAKHVWGELTPSTQKMASRLLRRLVKKGWLVTRRDGDRVNGEAFYALTKAGGRNLRFALPAERLHARDWLRHAHAHRTMANNVFVTRTDFSAYPRGETHISELEIRQDGSHYNIETFTFTMDDHPQGKIPDVVFGNSSNLIWVEVENSWRSTKDLNKLVAFLRALFRNGAQKYKEVWLVVTAAVARTIGQRLRAALDHSDPLDGWPRQIKELDAQLLERYVKVWVLDLKTLTLHPEAEMKRILGA